MNSVATIEKSYPIYINLTLASYKFTFYGQPISGTYTTQIVAPINE